MLVIANGAFKSGSTWQREIIINLMEFQDIPKEYQVPSLPHWIHPRKLSVLIRSGEHLNNNYITKAHLLSEKYVKLLVGVEGVRVLNIRRDVRDVLVSHYYHLRREDKCPKEFGKYYYRIGRYKAQQVRHYHQMWDRPGVYCSTFELLKSDFEAEVVRIAEYIGLSLDEKKIRDIKDATSLDRLRNPTSTKDQARLPASQFFRSGKIGGWKEYFDDDMVADLDRIEVSGLSGLSLLNYHLLFTVRGYLKSSLSNRAMWLDRVLRWL
jgi:hypothetical protein